MVQTSTIDDCDREDDDGDDNEKQKGKKDATDAAADRVREAIDLYCDYWERQLLQEYREQKEQGKLQRAKWSTQRLEARGLAILEAFAEPDGEILGEKIVRIVRTETDEHGRRKQRKAPWHSLFRKGDILEMTPYETANSSFQSTFRTKSAMDKLEVQALYTRRECLVTDIADDWMTVSVGPTWPAGLWEARKSAGGYTVRINRSIAPLAPLRAQQEALQNLRSQGRSDPWALNRSKSSPVASFLAQCTIEDSTPEVHLMENNGRVLPKPPKDWAGQIQGREPRKECAVWKALDQVIGRSSSSPNSSQQEAIVWALQRQIALIQGPPGTGKSKLAAMLIAAALQVKKNERCLAVAHSNGAADVLLQNLLELGVPAIRAGRANSVSPSVQHRSVVALAEKMPHVIQFRRSQLGDGITSSQEWELQQLLQDAQQTLLQSAPVVVTSCIGARYLEDAGEMNFPLLVLDEAAQCTEPALMCALMASHADQLVLVGDTQQLPPTVATASKELQKSLGTSPMARLENLSVPRYTLRVQYRMPPSLMEHPSKYSYNGLVESANHTESLICAPPPRGFPWPSPDIPLSFIHVGNQNEETIHNGGGRSNAEEASLVAKFVSNLLGGDDITSSGIAVLTPYSNQVQAIQIELEKASLQARSGSGRGNQPRHVTVGTVDSFQGQETDVIIFSAVRSNPLSELGFLRDRRRLNVAITRSRRGLIIVGDVQTLASCRHWKALIEFSRAKGAVCLGGTAQLKDEKQAVTSITDDTEELFGYKENEFYDLFEK